MQVFCRATVLVSDNTINQRFLLTSFVLFSTKFVLHAQMTYGSTLLFDTRIIFMSATQYFSKQQDYFFTKSFMCWFILHRVTTSLHSLMQTSIHFLLIVYCWLHTLQIFVEIFIVPQTVHKPNKTLSGCQWFIVYKQKSNHSEIRIVSDFVSLSEKTDNTLLLSEEQLSNVNVTLYIPALFHLKKFI